MRLGRIGGVIVDGLPSDRVLGLVNGLPSDRVLGLVNGLPGNGILLLVNRFPGNGILLLVNGLPSNGVLDTASTRYWSLGRIHSLEVHISRYGIVRLGRIGGVIVDGLPSDRVLRLVDGLPGDRVLRLVDGLPGDRVLGLVNGLPSYGVLDTVSTRHWPLGGIHSLEVHISRYGVVGLGRIGSLIAVGDLSSAARLVRASDRYWSLCCDNSTIGEFVEERPRGVFLA